jgi:carboxymethylenebutenolidase
MGDTVSSDMIRVDTAAGAFEGYLAEPAQPTGRAVVVLQEIFGVTKKIRGYCELFAQAGYAALAPDLFWRQAPGVQLSHAEGDLKKAFQLLGGLDDGDALSDVQACVAELKKRGATKVAVVGFCLGGKLAALSAAGALADAAVSFYGVGLEKHLDDLRAVRCPMQMHFGGKDSYVPEAALAAIRGAVPNPGNLHLYPEAGHAFFRPDLKDAESAAAWDRSRAFLNQHLANQ